MTAPDPASPGAPLAGYTVVDLTVARAGPVAVRLLTDWGANVIRIEAPPSRSNGSVIGHRYSSDTQNLHRNKRGLCLDLKSEEGRKVLGRLIERADVVVENFRSDVKARLGLTYEELSKRNPRIVLASISGWGQDGPYQDRPGVDQVMQGVSGVMSVTGELGGMPMRAGIAISDTTAGMFLGQGILLALLHRERTGKGQWVHTSLLEGMVNKLDFQAARYTVEGEVPARQGNGHPSLAPSGVYPASDGLFIISATSPRMWERLCKALDMHDLFNDPDYATPQLRTGNRPLLDKRIGEFASKYTMAELDERLTRHEVPCGPVYDIGQTFADPQVRHLGMTRPVQHHVLGELNLIRSPINMSACPHPAAYHRAAPDAGEHTRELLAELGYDAQAIDQLIATGVASGQVKEKWPL